MATAGIDKENAGAGAGAGSVGKPLFSPSKYQSAIGRTQSEGLFGRILQASNEAKTQCDEKLATKLAARVKAEEEAWLEQKQKEEEASRQVAERLHQEEKDGALAEEMSQQELDELNKWKKEVATIEEEDRKLVERMMEEEAEFQKKLAEQQRLDSEAASKLQEEEVEEVHKFIRSVAKQWKKPKIVCNDVDEGMLITVALPHVDKMTVHVDDVEHTITVVASPDFSYIAKFSGRIPEHMQPKSVDINLDLKIVGKDDVSVHDVKTRYDKASSMAYIFVRNACLKSTKSMFVDKLKGGLKRLLRRPSFMSKSRKK